MKDTSVLIYPPQRKGQRVLKRLYEECVILTAEHQGKTQRTSIDARRQTDYEGASPYVYSMALQKSITG